MAITVRGSGIQYANNVSSQAIALPAGSAAGDMCYLLIANGWGVSSVVGAAGQTWTQLDFTNTTNWNGAVYQKLLTAADISQGNVTVTWLGTYWGELGIVVFVGAAAILRTLISSRNSSYGATRTLTTDATPRTGDYAIYWGAGRLNNTVSSSLGATLQSSAANEASCILAGALLGADGALTSNFGYAGGAGNGDYQVIVVVRPTEATTNVLDSTRKSAFINLSQSKLNATSTGAGGGASVRRMTGNTYFEAVVPILTGTPEIGVSSGNTLGTTDPQTLADSVMYLPTGAVRNNGATLATIQTYAAGNRIGIAINPRDRLIWFRTNGGNWNNSGTADPATNTGGIDISAIVLQTFVLCYWASVTGTTWMFNLDAASFVDAAPAGYSDLSVCQYTLAMNMAVAYEAYTAFTPDFSIAAKAMPHPNDVKYRIITPAGPITMVSGVTQESGVNVPFKRVDVYDRDSGELLDTVYSDVTGAWTAHCMGRPRVRIVGSDPTAFNSQVYDNVAGS